MAEHEAIVVSNHRKNGEEKPMVIHRSAFHVQHETDANARVESHLIGKARRRGDIQHLSLAQSSTVPNIRGLLERITNVRGLLENVRHNNEIINIREILEKIKNTNERDLNINHVAALKHISAVIDSQATGSDQKPVDIKRKSVLNTPRKGVAVRTKGDKLEDGFLTLKAFIKESEGRLRSTKAGKPNTFCGIPDKRLDLSSIVPDRKNKEFRPKTARPRLTSPSKKTPRTKKLENKLDEKRPTLAVQDKNETKKVKVPTLALSLLPKVEEQQVEVIEEEKKAVTVRGGKMSSKEKRQLEQKTRGNLFPGRLQDPQKYRAKVYVSPVDGTSKPRPIQLPTLQQWIASAGTIPTKQENNNDDDENNNSSQLTGQKRLAKLRKKLKDQEKEDLKELEARGYKLVDAVKETWFQDSKNPNNVNKTENDNGNGAEKSVTENVTTTNPTSTLLQEEQNTDQAFQHILQLMSGSDPRIDPAVRLADTLNSAREVRGQHRQRLQQTLYSMDADRMNSARRRCKHLRTTAEPNGKGKILGVKEATRIMRLEAERAMLQEQLSREADVTWYKQMVDQVLASQIGAKRIDMHPAVFYLFDCLARVIEHGSELDERLCFELFSKLNQEEFEVPVVLQILKGVAEHCKVLPGQDGKDRICEWFEEKFGYVPEMLLDAFWSIAVPVNEKSTPKNTNEDEDNPKTFVTSNANE